MDLAGRGGFSDCEDVKFGDRFLFPVSGGDGPTRGRVRIFDEELETFRQSLAAAALDIGDALGDVLHFEGNANVGVGLREARTGVG